MIIWSLINGGTIHDIGLIGTFLTEDDPDDAVVQFDKNYGHGGGWRDMPKFEFDPETLKLTYPGDPPMQPLAMAQLRDETIYVYPYAWVLVLQKDGSFAASRMD